MHGAPGGLAEHWVPSIQPLGDAMPHFDLPLTLQLTPGQCLSWSAAPKARLTVISGRVWWTRRGDAQDHFLHAGQACDLRPGAGDLIAGETGAGPVCVRIEAVSGSRSGQPRATRSVPVPTGGALAWLRPRRAEPDGMIFGCPNAATS